MSAKAYRRSLHADRAGTLSGLFQRRVAKTPKAIAYLQYDPAKKKWKRYTWQEMEHRVARWQHALAKENFAPGERVAILLNNSVDWVCFDLASLSLQLVVVPLDISGSHENAAYILEDSGARLLLVEDIEQWTPLASHHNRLAALQKVLSMNSDSIPIMDNRITVQCVKDWLDKDTPASVDYAVNRDAVATIVYTSGTSGRPKGVTLTHHNILWNVRAVLKAIPGDRKDRYLSYLPLSQIFERVLGYYAPMMTGGHVAFARSAKDLPEDLITQRPTVLISTPRLFEQFYTEVQRRLEEKGVLARALFKWTVTLGLRRSEQAQGGGKKAIYIQRVLWVILKRLVADRVLARLGGHLRLAVSSGAPLPVKVSHGLLGLGLPLIQGYGLTEAAAIVSINRPDKNIPDSAGEPLPGIEVGISEEGELLVRAPSVMLGYWNRPEDTRQAIDSDGWLHTGDQARIVDEYIFIRDREPSL
ncbi:MAG: AMP-binding protein [Gammaproteobacteria bacterium]